MRVLSHNTLIDFFTKHKDVEIAIEDWYHKTLKAQWNNFAEVKKTFSSVDYVGNQRYVFDIRNNDYRIVAVIKFQIKMVYIRFVGTHKEYDEIQNRIKNI